VEYTILGVSIAILVCAVVLLVRSFMPGTPKVKVSGTGTVAPPPKEEDSKGKPEMKKPS